jgi:hypothetical protein
LRLTAGRKENLVLHVNSQPGAPAAFTR